MFARFWACLALAAGLLPAAPKTEATALGENQVVAITVTLTIDAAGVKDLIGDGLDGHYIVAKIKIEPKYGQQVSISRDDFVLRTNRDGEHTTPYAPSQIVGGTALVVREVKRERGPGPPSPYDDSNIPVGVTLQKGDVPDKENPLEQLLKDKELAEQKTNQPYSGLLYFAMEKEKMKDLELDYSTGPSRVVLKFK